MRPTLATFGTLNPLASPASKYRLSAQLRKLRITSENVMRQTANVKCSFTGAQDRTRSGLNRTSGGRKLIFCQGQTLIDPLVHHLLHGLNQGHVNPGD
jgi:hypothetical protein